MEVNMQIYNASSIDRNGRFAKAIAAGIATAIGCGIAYGLLMGLIHIESSIFFVLIGYAIANVLRKIGRGVTKKYQVAGALITVLAIIVGDLCAMYGVVGFFQLLISPAYWGDAITVWMQVHLSTNLNALLGLALRACGVYVGYYYSVIL